MRPIRLLQTEYSTIAWSVGLSVTIVTPSKSTELIKMPFGLWTRVSPMYHVLDRSLDHPCEGAILRGKGAAHRNRTVCRELCKTAEPIEMPFEVRPLVGQRKHELNWVALAQPGEYD